MQTYPFVFKHLLLLSISAHEDRKLKKTQNCDKKSISFSALLLLLVTREKHFKIELENLFPAPPSVNPDRVNVKTLHDWMNSQLKISSISFVILNLGAEEMSDPESVECYLNRDTSGRSNLQISSTEGLGR